MPSIYHERLYKKKYARKRRGNFRNKVRKGRSNPCVSVSKWGPMCDMHKCVFHYNERISVATAIFPIYRFRANSIYDCDLTGTGRAVTGHVEMSALFNRYFVRYAKITVRFASAAAISRACLVTSNGNFAYLTYDDLAGSDRCKSTILPNVTTDTVTRTLTATVNLKKLYGRKNLDDDNVQADVGNSPTEAAEFIIGLQNIDGSSTTSCYIDVDIKLYTTLFDKKHLTN